jgi:hypothetical protein
MEEKRQFHQKIEERASAAPDPALIFSVLEKDIFAGENSDRCRQVLSKTNIWQALNPDRQLRWARLAQAAGEMNTALAVLTHITRTQPQFQEAWQELLELLLILDRKEEIAANLVFMKQHMPAGFHDQWMQKAQGRLQVSDDGAADAAAVPFERLRRRQELIDHYLFLFSGREDRFARQWANKAENKQGYVPVDRPMDRADVEDHISGVKTYGMYLMKSDAAVAAAVIDVDLAKKFRGVKVSAEDKQAIFRERAYLLSRITELAGAMGLKPLGEFSGGKGFHFWFLFHPPLPARLARNALTRIAEPLSRDVTTFHLEVFPKQDHLSGKGYGNLVKLPLGVHRLSGKRSFFIGCRDHAETAQLEFLMTVKPTDPGNLMEILSTPENAEIVMHPAMKPFADKHPELYKLECRCAPIAQIAAACRTGKELTLREEKILYQTIGFLPEGKAYLHDLMACQPDYNTHLVDYKLSRVRSTPLGCKRIHSLLNYMGDFCRFDKKAAYLHPLLHLDWTGEPPVKCERLENLAGAINNLKLAIDQVERFI